MHVLPETCWVNGFSMPTVYLLANSVGKVEHCMHFIIYYWIAYILLPLNISINISFNLY